MIEVAPTLSPIAAAKLLAPPFEPVRVKVWALLLPKAIAPVLEKFTKAANVVPEASRVAELPAASPIVKRRSLAPAAVPLKRSVPPPKTSLLAALVAAPRLLVAPPLARLATFKIPPSRVVVPV